MDDLFQKLEFLNSNLKIAIDKENKSGELSCFAVPDNDELKFSGNTLMISKSSYLKILIDELEAKIVQLSTVSISDFMYFFVIFGDSIKIEYDGDFVILYMLSSDGTKHHMATGPLGDISLFVKTDKGLELNKILLDFATDDIIDFVKFYINFKDTFVSQPYSVFDAAQLYKGLRYSEMYILK